MSGHFHQTTVTHAHHHHHRHVAMAAPHDTSHSTAGSQWLGTKPRPGDVIATITGHGKEGSCNTYLLHYAPPSNSGCADCVSNAECLIGGSLDDSVCGGSPPVGCDMGKCTQIGCECFGTVAYDLLPAWSETTRSATQYKVYVHSRTPVGDSGQYVIAWAYNGASTDTYVHQDNSTVYSKENMMNEWPPLDQTLIFHSLLGGKQVEIVMTKRQAS